MIVACDFNSKEKLVEFLDSMESAEDNMYCKVGMELFDTGALEGFSPVAMIKERGHKVFLDLKLKDIPNTVSKTVKKLVEAEVDMINLHADGGYKMMKAAVDAVDEVYNSYEEDYQSLANDFSYPVCAYKDALRKTIDSRPLLLGVTVLTSMSEEELREEIGVDKTPREQVVDLALLCKKAGLDGVVCSPEEILAVKEACGEDFITVTPGIRFSDSKKDDQTRIATPACANIMGADYIVVGRPITQAENPTEAYQKCKRDFTEKVTDVEELENTKFYIESIEMKEKETPKVRRKKMKEVISKRETLKLRY